MADLDLEAAFAAMLERAAAAMHEVVDEVVRPRVQEIIPVAKGVAQASIRTLDPIIDGDTVTVTLTGGRDDDGDGTHAPSNSYIVPLHERIDIRHATGSAKFMETAQLEAAPTFAEQVAARMK